jgi:hypothetical protein
MVALAQRHDVGWIKSTMRSIAEFDDVMQLGCYRQCAVKILTVSAQCIVTIG